MSNTATNVTTGKPKIGGAIYRALRTSNLQIPTTAGATLSADYKCLGYISEDGVKNGIKKESDKVKAWGGDVVLVLNKGMEDTFGFKMIEMLNEDVLKSVFGDSNVTITEATSSTPKSIAVNVNGSDQVEAVWIIDMLMRGGNPKRIVIPYGTISDIGDIVYKDDDAAGYDVTLTATPDSSGNTHYEYMTVGSPTT